MKRIAFVTVTKFIFAFAMIGQTPCPTISVTGPRGLPIQGEPMTFTANLGKEIENHKIEYVWEVSGGKIVSGQGTLNLKALMDKMCSVTATLEVKGLPKDCPKQVSALAEISECNLPTQSRKIDDNITCALPITLDEIYESNWRDEKPRLQHAANELPNYENFGIVIRISAPPKDKTGFIKNRSKRFEKFLIEVSKVPKDKIQIISGSSDDYWITFYLVPLLAFDAVQNESESKPNSSPPQSKPRKKN